MRTEREADGMAAEQERSGKTVLGVVLVACTAIGIFGAGRTGDLSVAVTWIWMGISLSALFLLYRIAITLERISDRFY